MAQAAVPPNTCEQHAHANKQASSSPISGAPSCSCLQVASVVPIYHTHAHTHTHTHTLPTSTSSKITSGCAAKRKRHSRRHTHTAITHMLLLKCLREPRRQLGHVSHHQDTLVNAFVQLLVTATGRTPVCAWTNATYQETNKRHSRHTNTEKQPT